MTYKIALALHIISGFLALSSGLFSVIFKKGGIWHRRSGKVFFYSMLGVCFSSFYISILKSNQFLFHIGIFSLYMNYFGFMAVKNKSLKPKPLDWPILIAAGINCIFMLLSGNIVLMVFGGICVYTLLQNIRVIVAVLRGKELQPFAWLRMHIGMMMGAFIATTTAFLLVNVESLPFEHLPYWFTWFLPAVLLLPLSIYYTRRYVIQPQRRFEEKAPSEK